MAASHKISNGAGPSESKYPISPSDAPAPAAKSYSKASPKSSPGLLAQFKILRELSQRPLPTANGDGTYSKKLVRPGFRQDLTRIGMNGA